MFKRGSKRTQADRLWAVGLQAVILKIPKGHEAGKIDGEGGHAVYFEFQPMAGYHIAVVGVPPVFGDGAGEETRTLDVYLGKVVLYQLSYTRIALEDTRNRAFWGTIRGH